MTSQPVTDREMLATASAGLDLAPDQEEMLASEFPLEMLRPPTPPDSPQLTRQDAIAGKGLMDLFHYEDLDPPDLAEYFAEFDVDDEDQIRLCRSYASYLASKRRKRRKNQ